MSNAITEQPIPKWYIHSIKATLHSWELPSWPVEALRSATAAALRYAWLQVLPEQFPWTEGHPVRIEIAYNAAPDETVIDPMTGRSSCRGMKLEMEIRGGTEHEKHVAQHWVANVLEGSMARTLQMFIEHDAIQRYRQMGSAYKTRRGVDEPGPATMPINT